MILLGWSWVLLFSAQMTLLPPLAATSSSVASGVTTLAKPGCRDKCGHLTIPYPFGIDHEDCYHDAGFKVACVEGRTYLHNASSNIVIASISLLEAQLRIYSPFHWECHGSNGSTSSQESTSDLPRHFTASSKKNKLTGVGFNALAITLRQSKRLRDLNCISICHDELNVHLVGQSCSSSVGYCQTDLEGNNLKIKYKDGFPIVMDWVVGHEACGKAMMNGTSYACRSRNSQCINSPNAPDGYLCNCSDGYTGNPYLEQGCLGEQILNLIS